MSCFCCRNIITTVCCTDNNRNILVYSNFIGVYGSPKEIIVISLYQHFYNKPRFLLYNRLSVFNICLVLPEPEGNTSGLAFCLALESISKYVLSFKVSPEAIRNFQEGFLDYPQSLKGYFFPTFSPPQSNTMFPSLSK